MSDQFLAEIRPFACNFAPKGWAFCNGQLMAISQNTALFALLGTSYGGDGRSNFALPNLQGSVPLHVGSSNGPGLSAYSLGQSGGASAVSLLSAQMPSHGHTLQADTGRGVYANPTSATLARSFGATAYAPAPGTPATMDPGALATAGSSAAHNNLMPYLTINFCIALQGIFPPRS